MYYPNVALTNDELLRNAITSVFFYVDPLNIARITKNRKEYQSEAVEVVSKIRSLSCVTAENIFFICDKAIWGSWQPQHKNKRWGKCVPVIIWLLAHEGQWTLE